MKKIAPGADHGFIGDKKSKAKPREIDNSWIYKHWYARDMVWYNDLFCNPELKQLIQIRLDNNFYENMQ